MPINPSALSSPDPDGNPPSEAAAAALAGATNEQEDASAQPQRKRRTKAELIAAAVVPAPDTPTEVKDAGTGAKVQRPWSEAVALVKANQAEFVDKSLKYAVLKMDQEPVAASSAFSQPAQPSEDPAEREVRYTVDGQALLKTALNYGTDPNGRDYSVITYSGDGGESGTMTSDEWELLSMSPPPRDGGAASSNVPPEAELGDEVRVGAETMRVGHGGVLTNSPVAVDGEVVKPKRRWQRELGSGPNGPWQSTLIGGTVPAHPESGAFAETPAQNGNGNAEQASDVVEQAVRSGEPVVQSERLPAEVERVSELTWKVGTGILEKIGLPDYSSLQVGPISASRMVVDDGRRSEVTIGNRKALVPTAVIEVFREAMDVTEYIARHQRGELVSFLQSTGALKQPVS